MATAYLARQGVAFRGDNESDDSSNNGNFLELLELIGELSPQLRDRMAIRYGHYASPSYQNDIISCLAQSVRESVVGSIGPFWALLVDESKDASRKEQLSFCIRYACDGQIFEKPLGVSHMMEQNAEALATEIQQIVTTTKLSWENCVGQCFDGASVMSGHFNGVRPRIKAIAPHVAYVHCHAYRLNLVLMNTIRDIPEFVDVFSKVQSVYVFLTVSSPRHELFIHAQKESGLEVLELERLVETRWYY